MNMKLLFFMPSTLYGEWMLRHSTIPSIPGNRVIVHIYPENQITLCYRFMKGPFVFHKSQTGNYDLTPSHEDDQQHDVDVCIHHTLETFLSAYGIGLQDMNIRTSEKTLDTTYKMHMTRVGMDDLYLRSRSNDGTCFHLVRSVRINEPSVDIPIMTFLITNIIGTLIGNIIHLLLFHSP